jgi:hypothetical protein
MCDFSLQSFQFLLIQCCGSVTCWYRSGSGYANPYLWLTDLIRILLFLSMTFKTLTRNNFLTSFLLMTFWSYIYLVHNLPKINCHKEVKKQSKSRFYLKSKVKNFRSMEFFLFFVKMWYLFLIEDKKIRMAQNIRIRIGNTVLKGTGYRGYRTGYHRQRTLPVPEQRYSVQ